MPHSEPHWVLVCGGFHDAGGMDCLNAALARHLAARGTAVHLVGHDIDPSFDDAPLTTVMRVPRPGGVYLAGEVALGRAARRVRNAVAGREGAPIVVGNGGNCLDADVNWVHSVHHAWACADRGAPAWFKAKNRVFKAWSRRREAAAVHSARSIVANSRRTKRDLTTHLRVPDRRITIVYPGTDPSWAPAAAPVRAAARARWCDHADRPLVVMVGAVGHDLNKGLDTLLSAWTLVRSRADWDAHLVVAGPGDTSRWRAAAGGGSVRFAGRITGAGDLFDAADLVVSPVRYEAYGLAVHEALCRGVPAFVSRAAGIVERFPADFESLLLDSGCTAESLAARLLAWRGNVAAWRARVEPLGRLLRARTMDTMCQEIASVGDATSAAHHAGADA